MSRTKINPLLWELVAAHRGARREDLAQALDACGLRQTGGPIFGVEFVTIDANNYAPEPNGKPAVIVPYFVGGELVDLVATGLATRTCRTREGLCVALGMDAIEQARWNEGQLRLYSDPLEWLQRGRQGACVVDWRAARHVLADVPGIACSSDALAARVEKALRQPVQLPSLYVREVAHAA
jgi:hypothetical protein